MRLKAGSISPGEILEARERRCFEFLRGIPAAAKYVLIGGYAVSAYGFPRYSVDLDIVLPKSHVRLFQKMAAAEGFRKEREASPGTAGSGKVIIYKTSQGVPVGLDFFVDSVHSRTTGSEYSFDYLSKNSEIREIRGRSLEARASARVPDREMLIALKMSSLRRQDMRDILVLCYERPMAERVAEHLKGWRQDVLRDCLNELSSYVESLDSSSFRSVFAASQQVLNRNISNSKYLLAKLLKTLSSVDKNQSGKGHGGSILGSAQKAPT